MDQDISLYPLFPYFSITQVLGVAALRQFGAADHHGLPAAAATAPGPSLDGARGAATDGTADAGRGDLHGIMGKS